MKTLVKLSLILFLFPIVTFGYDIDTKAYNKEKSISKTYIVNPDAQVNVSNAYGNVNIFLWDENKISIQVIIKVSGNNEKKVEARLNSIDVDINALVSKVTAKTVFESNEWKSSNTINYEINYIIKIPKNGSVDLNNKYGDISIEKLYGSAAIVCKYGSLNLGQFYNKNNAFKLAYSQNSSIDFIENLTLDCQYSDVDFIKATTVSIDGNYNSFNIKSVENLNLSSNYNKLKAISMQKVLIDGNYLTLKLGEISDAVKIDSNYSDIQFSTSNTTNSIDINANYTHTKISCDSNFDFNFNINLGYGSLKDDLGLKYTQKSEKNNSKSYSGYHNKSSKSVLNINTNYGSVQLLNK